MQEEPSKSDPEVDELVREEIDQPEQESKNPETSNSRWQRFKTWYGAHKKWSIPASFLVILVILSAIPWTRYNIAGLVLKKDFTVQVMDSTANTPVSGAVASVGGISSTTDGSGKVTLHGVKVGPRSVSISKEYYQTKSTKLVVPILGQKTVPSVALIATGRQVKINITNIITKKALVNVGIELAGTNAKTDDSGSALLVVPVGSTTQKAKLSLDGYNDADVTVEVSNSAIKENNFKLTPTGKVYFLSNRNGKLDVMKANLDGSDTKIVVPGTGSERLSDSFILQSANGKYVALVIKRKPSDPTAQLYVLAAADDKLLQTDSGNALFQLYDWVGDKLIYTVQRQDLPVWQQGASKIKAYDAATGATTLLDQTAGSDAIVDANEYYSELMVTANSVIYGKVWQGDGDFSTKHNSLQTIDVTGKNHQVLATYSVNDSVYFARYSPDSLYIWQLVTNSDSDKYFQYSADGSVKAANITNDQFYQGQYTYYFSPSGQKTFWTINRDGKNSLIVGNNSGESNSTIASLSGYDAYGWYSDQYLLVSKNSSELYIMDANGGTPVKITDYQATGYGGH